MAVVMVMLVAMVMVVIVVVERGVMVMVERGLSGEDKQEPHLIHSDSRKLTPTPTLTHPILKLNPTPIRLGFLPIELGVQQCLVAGLQGVQQHR